MSKQVTGLTVEVVDIQGNCPVYKVGDRFHIQDGYKLIAAQPLCMHALQSISPYYIPLSRDFPLLTSVWLDPMGPLTYNVSIPAATPAAVRSSSALPKQMNFPPRQPKENKRL